MLPSPAALLSAHATHTQFPEVADSVVHVLMDFLAGDGGMDVAIFVRSIVEQYASLRAGVLGKLLDSVRDISSAQVLCVSLWVVGTYCDGAEMLAQAFAELREAVGALPFETAAVSGTRGLRVALVLTLWHN
jgi:coatomer subunit beta